MLLAGDLGLSRSVSLRVCPLLILLRFCYNNIRTYNLQWVFVIDFLGD